MTVPVSHSVFYYILHLYLCIVHVHIYIYDNVNDLFVRSTIPYFSHNVYNSFSLALVCMIIHNFQLSLYIVITLPVFQTFEKFKLFGVLSIFRSNESLRKPITIGPRSLTIEHF